MPLQILYIGTNINKYLIKHQKERLSFCKGSLCIFRFVYLRQHYLDQAEGIISQPYTFYNLLN
jgi:hypothetical protein